MDYVRTGRITQTTARIWARSSNTGTLVATINGQQYAGDAVDPNTHDGCGAIDVTGLTAGTTYNATVSDGTESHTLTFRTAGNYTCGFVMSCQDINGRDPAISKARTLFDPDYLIWLGDTPYNDSAGTSWGITCVSTDDSLEAALDLANAYAHHRRMLEKREMNCIGESVCASIIKVKDDHEYLDNFNNDWTDQVSRNAYLTEQQDLDDIVAVQQEACASYSLGNRDNSDGIDYFSWTVGSHKFIVLDCIKYKQAPSTGIFLGDTQLAWFLSELSNAGGIDFITVLSSKTTSSGNGDAWYDYQQVARDELDDVFSHIEENQVTGVCWFTGDKHHPFVRYSDNPQSLGSPTAASPHLAVNGCPLSTNYQPPPGSGPDTVWSLFSDANGNKLGNGCIGVWEASDGRCDYYIVHDVRGVIWHGYQLAGSNVRYYETLKL